MAERVVDRLPSVEDVERELDRNRFEASILRTIHKVLKRRQSQEKAAEHFHRLSESGVAGGPALKIVGQLKPASVDINQVVVGVHQTSDGLALSMRSVWATRSNGTAPFGKCTFQERSFPSTISSMCPEHAGND